MVKGHKQFIKDQYKLKKLNLTKEIQTIFIKLTQHFKIMFKSFLRLQGSKRSTCGLPIRELSGTTFLERSRSVGIKSFKVFKNLNPKSLW